MENLLNNIPDKTEYKNTTSHKFKLDLVDFFKNKKLKKCLEIGTNHGHTTFVLSHLFDEVFTIDLHLENTEKAKKVNFERNNITYITDNAYNRNSYNGIQNIDCSFIDCVHTFEAVLFDIQTSLNLSSSEGLYLIFDDYGHPLSHGVNTAIKEGIKQGLKVEKYIGEEPGFKFYVGEDERVLIDHEGIIVSYGK